MDREEPLKMKNEITISAKILRECLNRLPPFNHPSYKNHPTIRIPITAPFSLKDFLEKEPQERNKIPVIKELVFTRDEEEQDWVLMNAQIVFIRIEETLYP